MIIREFTFRELAELLGDCDLIVMLTAMKREGVVLDFACFKTADVIIIAIDDKVDAAFTLEDLVASKHEAKLKPGERRASALKKRKHG